MTDERVDFVYTGVPPTRELKMTHGSVSPSVAVIPTEAFRRCTDLIEMKLCDGLRSIEDRAFEGCFSLERISIPSTVEIIGPLAFNCCGRLIDVVLCEGLQQIQQSAFVMCSSLERISIPSSVKEIGYGAFMYCSQLRNVELGKGWKILEDTLSHTVAHLSELLYPPVSKG
jgi:hypothetical protein